MMPTPETHEFYTTGDDGRATCHQVSREWSDAVLAGLGLAMPNAQDPVTVENVTKLAPATTEPSAIDVSNSRKAA